MKARFFVFVIALVGCEQATVVGSCGDGDVGNNKSNGAPLASDGGADAAEPPIEEFPNGFPGGRSCTENADCEYDTCLPSNSSSFEASYCFDRFQDGCMVVTSPHPFAALCNGPNAKVFVCGDAWDISTLGTCDDVGVGMLGETYRCCVSNGFP